MTLTNKIAIITGGNGAIGSKLKKKLIFEGVKCIIVDKDGDYSCDFRKIEEVTKLAELLAKNHPSIDFLYNIAGIGIYKNINDLTIEEWLDTHSINVTAPFILIKYLIKNISKSNGKMILNIGSGMGVIGAENRSSYCSSKFSLRGLSLSLRKELRPSGVDVCLFTLGSVMTPFGTGGIDKRKELERQGKKYLTVDEVVDKIVSVSKSNIREEEYVLYPEGYM